MKSESETSPVELLDLSALHAPLLDELRAAFDRVLASSSFIMGPEVEAFEREIAAYLGVDHAIGVSSGTDALLMSLMALEIGPGSDVITTPFSFFATAGCIARVGARPVFVDIEPGTFNLDLERLDAVITRNTRAIMPVHVFGQAVDLPRLRQLCDERALSLVEDAAQAIGARFGNAHVGGTGELACFSFFPAKNLGALGDAGLVTTSDAKLAERVRLLRSHGAREKYHHTLIGGNFRLDALQAALLRAKLPALDRWAAARQANAARYDALFAEAGLDSCLLTTPTPSVPGSVHVYNQYVVRTSRRQAVRDHLRGAGIATSVHYPRPLHLQPCLSHLGYRAGSFPEAERACDEVLALPIHPTLSEADVTRVAEAVVAVLAERA